MRVSIITGGGAGIGAAVARRLVARDQCLMLHGQGADAAGIERLKTVAAECQRAGATVAWRAGDLALAGTASELVRATREVFGSVDAIVHAAGLRIGAVSSRCRAQSSNGHSRSSPRHFTNWRLLPCRI